MAYREFYKRQDILLNDYSPLERGLTNLFAGMQQRQKDKQTAVDKFSYDLKGGFESDQKIFNELAGSVAKRVVNNGGYVDPETKLTMQQGKGWAELSELQRKRAESLNKRIDDLGVRNKYYDPTNDYLALQNVSNPEVNFQTRGSILDQIESNLGSPRNFKKTEYLADYVKDRQRSYKEKTYGNADAKNTKYDESTFWDEKTGKPGVTDDHAIDLLKSNQMFNENINLQVKDDLAEDIEKMKALGSDSRISWMKDKSDAEILNELINDPSKNIINQKNFGVRVREKAKNELEKFNAISSKTSYEKKEPSEKKGGIIKNDAIAHADTFYNNKISTEGVSDRVATASGFGGISGPGGILMIGKGVSSTGKPIQLNLDANKAFNIRTGKNADRTSGNVNITGYHLQVYDKGGNLYPIQGNSIEELTQSIQNLSDRSFLNLGPEMKIGLDGYSVDDKTMLNDIATKSFSISEQIGETQDPERKAELEAQLQELQRLRTMVNLEGISDEDIIHAANKQGIGKIRQDQVLLPTNADIDRIKAITGGLDLNNKEHWSKEMRDLNDLYSKRYQQAISAPKKTTGKTAGATEEPLKSSYNVNGTNYTLEALKKLGYTEEQIKEAAKLGNIK